MRARLLQLASVATVVASLAAGGCGGDDGSGELASMVPPDVPFYVEAVLRPDEDQRSAIESLTTRLGLDDPGARLIEAFDAGLAGEPGEFTYADDIEPWLGDRGAFFVRSFGSAGTETDGAAVVEVTDADAAQDFIDRAAEADPDVEETPRT